MDDTPKRNIDLDTVAGFGREWAAYDQFDLLPEEHAALFHAYFSIFPFDSLTRDAEGFDLGCGSGRWAFLLADRVGKLHCIDPAPAALRVARRRLQGKPNVRFHLADVDEIPLSDSSQDFGYSLGVLHHVPDTGAALRNCVRKLKVGAPFLLYLYYRFDNRRAWFRWVWIISDIGRKGISRLPFPARQGVTILLAATVYYPLARLSRWLSRRGWNVSNIPLSSYRDLSFYTMRTDALDRFGTKLEKRFTRQEIVDLMSKSGLANIRFRRGEPFWVACGFRLD